MNTTAHSAAARLADLLRAEHVAMADFLLALAEFDRTRGWLDLGYTGLHPFLVRELGLSNGAAHQRRTAAALLQRFPDLAAPLADGRLCLSTVFELARVLTPENRAEVLPRYFRLSAREAREVTAALCPVANPPLRELVRRVAPRVDPGQGVLTSERSETGTRELFEAPTSTPTPTPTSTSTPTPTPTPTPTSIPIPTAAPPKVTPLTADLRRFSLTVSRRFLEKLETARHARSHARPGATAEAILEEALDLLLERQARRRGQSKRRRVATRRARPSQEAGRLAEGRTEPQSESPTYVPAEVRAEVWSRDEGRCQWPTHDGASCGSTWQVEIDHVRPRARGGSPAPANLRLLCRFHNDLAARQSYGDAWMDRFTRREARGGREAPSRPVGSG
jgi:5-methylcytosine-specific restriction endonuclease McrA